VKAKAAALLLGLLFGVGLLLAGMTDPAKVTAFLDVTGRWDPSLALVMVGAIGVHALLRRRILRRPSPLLGGVCPGPGIVDAASGSRYALVFTATMALGAVAARLWLRGEGDGGVERPALLRDSQNLQ
jgi:uncharacterized protein